MRRLDQRLNARRVHVDRAFGHLKRTVEGADLPGDELLMEAMLRLSTWRKRHEEGTLGNSEPVVSEPRARKPHVLVPQDRYLEVLREVGGSALLNDIARFFDVSQATARRKLDGLVMQGKVRVAGEGSRREYAVAEASHA
jgi:hypothetical protein